MRHDEDVGEQDRPIETEPVDRLERNLASGLAVVGHREKSALLFPQSTILGQVTSCLPHEPERHAISALAVQRVE